MEYKSLENRKKEFDDVLIKYFSKRVFDNIGESDACNQDVIDSVGNILSQKDDWSFTHFDKLILALKNSLGEKYLRNLLKLYKYMEDIDPLFIMNMEKGTDMKKVRENLGLIVTKMEDSEYLPNALEHSEEHIEYDNENMNFCDKVSNALTVATFLLYTLRNDKVPTEIDFDKNVVPSVAITFNITPLKDYKKCLSYCNDYGLIDNSVISEEGIKKLVSISKYIIDGNIASNKIKRVENQSYNWGKLAKVEKDYA